MILMFSVSVDIVRDNNDKGYGGDNIVYDTDIKRDGDGD